MKSVCSVLLLGALLALPLSAAQAQAPSVSPLSNVYISAGTTATVNVVAVDLNGDIITLSSTLPSFVTLNAPTTGTGSVYTTLTVAPTASNVGVFTGSVKATAGGQVDSTTIQITVVAAGSNQAPVVTAPATQTATEGTNLSFTVTAFDADADLITSLNASGLPTGATFTPVGTNTSGTFSWTPSFSQSGDYDVVFQATAGGLTGGATTHIHVNDGVQLSISEISDRTIVANTTSTVNVNVTGPTAGTTTLTSSLPSWATLNAPTSSSGTGTLATTITLAPPTGTTGTFQGTVTATNGGQTDSENFSITVLASGSNQAPVVTAPVSQTVTEGVNLSFTVTASDAEGDVISSLVATGLPTGATFTPNGTNTGGTFSWTPSSSQAGGYDVVFTATSGTLTGAATTHIQVNDGAAGLLSIAEINDRNLAAGTTMTVNVNVTGPTTGTTSLSASLPSWATLNPPTSSSGTGTLSTTITLAPPAGTSGTFQATVTAMNGTLTDTEGFSITVTSTGGGTPIAKATLQGNFNTHKKFICFRVEAVNASFDVRDVNLADITLQFGGASITALSGKTHIECDDDDGDDGDDGDDCDDCDDGEWDSEHDDCDEGDCDDATLRACFAMSDIQDLFDGEQLPSAFVDATVNGTLTNGLTFSASVGSKFAGNNKGNKGKSGLNTKVRPNPVNPDTKLTFRLSQPGRVQVLIYDLQGRLIKTLLDENRTVGDHELTWNGSNSRKATVSSGVYFVRVKAPQGEEVQRVTVLK